MNLDWWEWWNNTSRTTPELDWIAFYGRPSNYNPSLQTEALCMIVASAASAIRITRLSCKNYINCSPAPLWNESKRSRQILQDTKKYNATTQVMNLRFVSFAALAATSSAWISPAPISTKRSIRHCARKQHTPLSIRPFTKSTTKTALGSALAAPSSSSSDATSGRPIAMGSIVNVFRGGLVAVRIDDDLSKVAISLEVNIPEVVDPSESVPDELKSKKSSSDDLGMLDWFLTCC